MTCSSPISSHRIRRTLGGLAAGALCLGLLGGAPALAETPLLIGYQAAVFDGQGLPAAGPVDVDVAIFDAASGGTVLYAESHPGVSLVDGAFDIQIGSGSLIGTPDGDTSAMVPLGADTFATAEAWLELTIDGEVLGPRQRVVAVPYALRAKVAESLDSTIGAVPYADTAGRASVAGALSAEQPPLGESVNLLGVGLDESGSPIADGARIHFQQGFFPESQWRDALVFENTDTSLGAPDGGFAFTNRSADETSTAMVIRGNGKVGIGTDSPVRKLHVVGGTRVDGFIEVFRDTQYPSIHARNSGPGEVIWLENEGQGDFIVAWDRTAPSASRKRFWVDDQGVTHVRTLKIHGGADLSESFDVTSVAPELPVEPGTIVSIDPDDPGRLVVSEGAYSRTVAGVVAGAGGIEPGMLLRQQGMAEADGAHPVALTGRVYAKADTSNGPIQPGDLLTTSDRPGHAMKASDWQRSQGAVLGKAMSGLDEETGMVLVLVGLQ